MAAITILLRQTIHFTGHLSSIRHFSRTSRVSNYPKPLPSYCKLSNRCYEGPVGRRRSRRLPYVPPPRFSSFLTRTPRSRPDNYFYPFPACICCGCASDGFKVAVLGAAGGIGQPLSLLLKENPLVGELALYDTAKVTPGVAVDLSHINSKTIVRGYTGDGLKEALEGAHVVIIPAGLPRKPGMTRDDLFSKNAGIAYELGKNIGKICPCALVGIITNPVNATVPIVAEALAQCGVFDPGRLFGVTTLDLVRAETFVAQLNCCDPKTQRVPVIGGHAGTTIIPLLSQSWPRLNIQGQERDALVKRIQEAGTEVVKAKAGGGSATLSMAYAAGRFTNSLLRGLSGEPCVYEYSYVKSDINKASFFSSRIVLGTRGIEQLLGYGPINDYEKQLVDKAIPVLQKNIANGIKFSKSKASK